MGNIEFNDFLAMLGTPIDFAPLRAKADDIKANLDALDAELDALKAELDSIVENTNILNDRLQNF